MFDWVLFLKTQNFFLDKGTAPIVCHLIYWAVYTVVSKVGCCGKNTLALFVFQYLDQEIIKSASKTFRRLYSNSFSKWFNASPVRVCMQLKIWVTIRPIPCLGRHAHPDIQNVIHETPSSGIIEIPKMSQKTICDTPMINVLPSMTSPPVKHGYLSPSLESANNIITRCCPDFQKNRATFFLLSD